MAGHREHVRTGFLFYGAFLVAALGAWLYGREEYFGWTWHLLPFGDTRWASASGFVLCFLIAVLASLWPDVDIKSVGQVLFYRLFFLVDAALVALFFLRGDRRYLLGAAFLGLLAMLPLVGKHRGWTHSRAAMVLVPAPAVFAPMLLAQQVTWVGLPFYVAAFLGYASHLYRDGRLLRR
jgi:hypothetical protein